MPSQLDLPTTPTRERAGPDRRWLALGVIAAAQLVIVLDASIVTIALPKAQTALHISDSARQWVQTAYTVSFGGLLLLGGRIADYVGRKRVFILGLLGFAAASALGGAAPNAGLLFAARALQGSLAAVLAPAALALITTTFTEPRERAKAFGVYGGISGAGAAIGLIAGGALTEYLSWRWTLLVNVPIALLIAALAVPFVRESRASGDRTYDLRGALIATSGLVALVYGFTEASTRSWGDPLTLALIGAAVVLLVAFVRYERRVANPLLPLRIVTDRNRGGSFLAFLLATLGMFGVFLFLTYYFQGVLGWGALKTGFAFVPFSVGIIVSAAVASTLLPRFGPRRLATTGFALGTVGLVWLTQLDPSSSYAGHILPSELLISTGMAQVFVSLSNTALVGVAPHDAGVASALVNTAQQVGGSLGVAFLNTIATNATTGYARAHGASKIAVVHGFTTAFAFSAAALALGGLAVAVLVRASRHDLVAVTGEPLVDEPYPLEPAPVAGS